MSSIDSNDYTLGQVFETLEESGAGLMTVVFRDEADTPIRGFVAFDGEETGIPLLEAVGKIEEANRG